jgi:hypothetical protein
VKKIVRALHVSRNTVRKILRSDETDFAYERERQPLQRIGAWKAEIERFLTANEGKPSRERLTLIRIYEEVRALGHDQSVAPANLEPIKSDLAQRLVGGAQPYRTKNDTQLGGIVLFKNNRRQSRQFETAVDGPNLVGTRCNRFLFPAVEPNNSSARNGFFAIDEKCRLGLPVLLLW